MKIFGIVTIHCSGCNLTLDETLFATTQNAAATSRHPVQIWKKFVQCSKRPKAALIQYCSYAGLQAQSVKYSVWRKSVWKSFHLFLFHVWRHIVALEFCGGLVWWQYECMIVRLLYFLLSLFQWFSIFNLIILCIVVKISDGAQKNVLFCTMSDSASVIFPCSTVHTTYPPHSRHSHAPTLSKIHPSVHEYIGNANILEYIGNT